MLKSFHIHRSKSAQSAIANINYINVSLKQSVWHTDRVNRRGKNYSQQINMLSGAAFLNTNASTVSCITSVCDNVDAITFHRGICKWERVVSAFPRVTTFKPRFLI